MSTNLKNTIQCSSKNKRFSVELVSNKELNFDFLSTIQPLFYSVTWHFKKLSTIENIIQSPAMSMAINLSSQGKNVLLHLPCRYLSKQTVFDILTIANQHNIKNIFALLGESIEGNKCSDDFKHAVDLVRFIKVNFGDTFCICVPGYPKNNSEQSKYDLDLKYLKEKVDLGADFIITQVIFDSETFNEFYEDCRNININVPIIPGLYLINSYNTVLTMAKICHVHIPEKTLKYFESIKHDDIALQKHAEDLVNNLLMSKNCPISVVHIFCLNNIGLVEKLTKNIPAREHKMIIKDQINNYLCSCQK